MTSVVSYLAWEHRVKSGPDSVHVEALDTECNKRIAMIRSLSFQKIPMWDKCMAVQNCNTIRTDCSV